MAGGDLRFASQRLSVSISAHTSRLGWVGLDISARTVAASTSRQGSLSWHLPCLRRAQSGRCAVSAKGPPRLRWCIRGSGDLRAAYAPTEHPGARQKSVTQRSHTRVTRGPGSIHSQAQSLGGSGGRRWCPPPRPSSSLIMSQDLNIKPVKTPSAAGRPVPRLRLYRRLLHTVGALRPARPQQRDHLGWAFGGI